jgi:hypothetical protein
MTNHHDVVAGNAESLFDPLHDQFSWAFGFEDGKAFAGGMPRVELSHTLDVTPADTASAFASDEFQWPIADAKAGNGGDGIDTDIFTAQTSWNASFKDGDKLNVPVAVSVNWTAKDNAIHAADMSATDMASAFHSDIFAGQVADAKGAGGGGGGKPGGGGGSGGTVTTYTSGDPNVDNVSEFNIKINFSGSWTAQQQAVVKWAADLYSHIITADIQDALDLAGNLVDDVVISLSTGRIDGNGNPLTGNVLAQTSNLVVRDAGTTDEWLPLTASIKLDSTDLTKSALASSWDDIILHEMGHALGFVGAIFDHFHLVDSSGNFTGSSATAAYGGLVPLENDGGAGTAGSHWDEARFMPDGVHMSNELMTGYLVPGEQTYLSDTTVGAFADLGYTVQDPSIAASYLAVSGPVLV